MMDSFKIISFYNNLLLGTEKECTELMQLINDLTEKQSDLDAESNVATKCENKKREDGLRLREKSMLSLKEKQSIPNWSNSPADMNTPAIKRRCRPTPAASSSNQEELLQYINKRDKRAAELKKRELDIKKQKVDNQSNEIGMLQQIVLNRHKTTDKQ